MRRSSVLLLLLLCLCSRSSSQECRPELLENVDFPGTDLKFVYSPDVNHCQQMCTQYPNCLFFTFVRADWTRDNRHFYCYLKHTASGEPNQQTSLLGVTSGYSLRPCSSNSAPASCFDQTYQNIDFPGADYRFLFTPDLEECQRACTEDPGCQFFTWANDRFSSERISYKCHLKYSWTVPLTPIVMKKNALVSGFSDKIQINTGQTDFRDCTYKYFPGADIPGSNLLDVPAASPEQCQVLCSAHPACTYFSFQGTTCFLKNNPYEMMIEAKQGMTSGIPSRFCQQNREWLSVALEDVDFRGSDMRFVLLDDAASCQRTCSEDLHCQFYTYATENYSDPTFRRRCYLKRAVTVPAPPKVTFLEGVVSGFTLRSCDSAV